jgi:hypothetical protein
VAAPSRRPASSCRAGWVEEFEANGHDAECFALGGIDLADVGQLLLAGGQWVDRGDFLVVEHFVEVGVAGDAGDAGEDFVALTPNRISDPVLIFLRLESLTRISVVLRPEEIRLK